MPPEGPITVVPFDDFAAELIAEAAAARWLMMKCGTFECKQLDGRYLVWVNVPDYEWNWQPTSSGSTFLEALHAAVVAVQDGEKTP